MNNPSWRAEDGQLLRSLREEAGIDALVFARNNTVSLAQLKELELGGNNSFYNPAIKRTTGVKLLKKLGHELVMPDPVHMRIEPTETHEKEQTFAMATGMAQALVHQPKAPSSDRSRRLIQQAFWGSLGLLGLVALTAMKPWGIGDASATHLHAAVSVTQDPLPMVPSKPETKPSAPINQAQAPSSPPAKAIGLTPTSGEPPLAAIKVSAPTPASACDWQHRDHSKSHTPSQPLKPGNYVHLEAQADTELCVLDSQNQKTLLQLKAGMTKSVYGSAPFLVHSQELHTLKLFFQGRRVHEALDDMQYLLLNSQPL
jgi:hypothetical protein